MSRNKLIVFEGIDGAGKATQTKLLAKQLRAQGKRVAVFSSPRYDIRTGDLVRRALSGEFGDFVRLHPYVSALPYLVDFASWSADIRAALQKGDVICDRYVHSTLAYHAAKLSGTARATFLKEIGDVAFKSLQLPKPDVVVLLDVPVQVSQGLMMQKKKDQYEANIAYQKKVARAYTQLARGKEWRVITCAPRKEMRSRGEIHAEVLRQLSR